MTEVSKKTGVSWVTVRKIFLHMEGLGVIIKTNKIGKAQLFKLNLHSGLTRDILRLETGLGPELFPHEYEEKQDNEPQKVLPAQTAV